MTVASGLRAALISVSAAGIVALSACSTPAPTVPRAATTKAESGLDRMERVTLAANRCWFKSNDPAFARYSLAPELSSFSGKPRFLLVPKGRAEAKPLLVVEAQPGSRALSTYGPVMGTSLGARVDSDIRRWNTGDGSCRA
ncbi:hypothetical protein [Aureimonas glaciei]|jgi:hypothetical protein|uniref:Lipoprotein n=1 Tax=Aureimonas glaciei TaxID=1776957 RepID=A0A916XX49_9HYPH|nr:hypothetical protein [Aureimonas glaciei]GGD18325.1 hypothetical protein GCM10011335_21500 [Aureimonas glaciei]